MITRLRRYWLLFGFAALIAALLVSSPWPPRPDIRQSDRARPELAEAVAAAGQLRLFAPRLTGGFAYAALPPPHRGSTPPTHRSPDLAIAVARLEQVLSNRPGPRAMAAAGVGRLLSGDSNGAIHAIERALEDQPWQASWWSDLSAAYLVRGELETRQDDAVHALDAARRALRLAPDLPEAHFNLGHALERNALRAQAASEWQRFFSDSDGPGWKEEAGQRLRTDDVQLDGDTKWRDLRGLLLAADTVLDPSIVTRAARAFPQAARELIEDELLPAWGGAAASVAEPILQRATVLAQALRDGDGDRMPLDVCQVLSRSTGKRIRSDAARGLVAYGAARRLFAKAHHVPAVASFREAERRLAAAGNPLWGWALAHRAASERAQHRWPDALRDATRAAHFAKARGFVALEARATWTIGLTYDELGDPVAAYRDTKAAMEGFERIREVAQVGAAASTAADLARRIGDRRQGWELLGKALDTVEAERTPVRRYLRYYNASLFARQDELLEAGLAFQDEAVDAARACQPDTGALAQAFTQRAAVRVSLQEPDRAAADLAQARAVVGAAHDGILAYMHAEIALVEASLLVERDPDSARARLAEATAVLERASPSRLPELHLSLGRVLLRKGRDAEGRTELLAGLAYYERQRATISDETLRLGFFSTARALYGELIGLALRQGQTGEAFAYSDRARGRSLLDAGAARQNPPRVIDAPALAAIQARLPPGVAFVEYSLTGPEPVAWVMTATRFALIRLAFEPARVARTLDRDSETDTTLGAEASTVTLYDALIAPVRASLDEATTALVISPDGLLHLVPFAALQNSSTGRRLIEDYAIQLVPSLAWFLDASERWTARAAGRPASLLAVGNPAFDRQDLASLPDLPDAAREARAIATYYKHPKILVGRDATHDRVVESAGRVDVVHFGGHALANDDAPALSFLAVAPDSGRRNGRLLAFEIASLPLQRPRLVVLAACSTASGPVVFGEGILHLARPFLMAGVPVVLATLWDVEDRAAARLLVRFHQAVSAGDDPARALQQAQLAALRSTDPRDRDWRVWAPFLVIGGASQSVGRPVPF
jgi:CHAT domain-containing protein/tetratricopeptide (TPR) repeat protein